MSCGIVQDGPTTIGTRSDHIIPDICEWYHTHTHTHTHTLIHYPHTGISNSDLRADHCQVECVGHRVVLRPLSGECFINHKLISKATRLSQGEPIAS